MTDNRFDAAVIGGGAGGCSAAITLAQAEAKVVLFEAETYPHDKLCGEFLSPECAVVLQQLGVARALKEQGPATIESVRVTAANGVSWQAQLPGMAWGLSRKVLDATLARQAQALGVTLREGAKVTAVSGDMESGFEVEARSKMETSKLGASLVIGAYGKRGNLDRVLRRDFLQTDHPFIAFKAHFRGPSPGQAVELHGFPGGYCGLAEIEGQRQNVCLLANQPVFRQVTAGRSDPIASFVAWMGGQNPRLEDWFRQSERLNDSWLSIAQVPFLEKRSLVQDILMVGDAAGLIVPLAGDGIAMALEGGHLAGELGGRYLSGDMSAQALRREYPAAWQRTFGARLWLGKWLQMFVLRPYLLAAGLRILNALPGLGRYLVRHTRGLNPLSEPR
jgi:flavin-dependent dehydrogenase